MLIKQWDEVSDYEETLTFLTELALQHLARVVHESGAALAKEIRDRNWSRVVGWDINYDGNLSVSDAINLRQALGFFSKLEPLDLGLDKEKVARDQFLEDERLCRETNIIFKRWSQGDFCFPPDVELVLFKAQRKIANVLRDVPKISDLRLTFGPGATASVLKKNACARVKLSTRPSCSANLVSTLPELLGTLPHYTDLHSYYEFFVEDGELRHDVVTPVDVVPGRLEFVPKNAKTYRGVMKEPTLNALLQAGYGHDIREKLLGVGQNIRDQSINQRRAREGSITDRIATVDLKSASNTLSIGLVEHLTPYDWFAALSNCRTSVCQDDILGEVNLSMFSSMGNGYTFPLQTLIFWALTASCQANREAEHDVFVYGDDITCPSESIPLLHRVFSAVGLRMNMDKSYWSGPFRESCGKDYYFGVDIRPYYQKVLCSGITLFALHNFYVRSLDSELAEFVRTKISDDTVLYGPDGFGDGHLLGDWIPDPKARDRGWGGFCFDTYSQKPLYHKYMLPGDRVLPTYTVYVNDPTDALTGSAGRNAEDLFQSVQRRYHLNPPTSGEKWTTSPLPKRQRKGRVWDTLPGTNGFVKQTIYTLTR